jgi:hypothetical protein
MRYRDIRYQHETYCKSKDFLKPFLLSSSYLRPLLRSYDKKMEKKHSNENVGKRRLSNQTFFTL